MSKSINIYLVRHGEAAARWHEASDPGLSALGLSQAKAVSAAFAARPVRKILSSPLRRAQETAAPLAAVLSLPVTVDDHFREVPGPTELAARPAWIAALTHSTWDAVDNNVIAWRDALWTRLGTLTEDTAIFTHFMVINALVGRLNAASRVVYFEPDYCSVTWLQGTNGGAQVRALGATRETLVL